VIVKDKQISKSFAKQFNVLKHISGRYFLIEAGYNNDRMSKIVKNKEVF